MTGASAVLRRELRQLLRSRAFSVLVGINLCLAVGSGIGSGFVVRSIVRQATEARPADAGYSSAMNAEVLKGLIHSISRLVNVHFLFYLCLVPFLSLLWAFAGPLMTAERSSGTLPSLLATPLRPAQLWGGKTLALFIAAFVMELACIAVHVVGLGVVLAVVGRSLPALGGTTVATMLFATPALFFALYGVTIGIAFVKGADAALVPSFLVGFLIMLGAPAGTGAGLFDIASWGFFGGYVAGAGVLFVGLLLAGRRFTKEAIVLSSASE